MDHLHLRARSLLPSPETLHADWRPARRLSAAHSRMLELVNERTPSHTICVQHHTCLLSVVEEDAVVLTTATCRILQCGAGGQVRVTPIAPSRVQILPDSTLPVSLQEPVGVLSASLALLLASNLQHHREGMLCPQAYTGGRLPCRVQIAGIRKDPEEGLQADPAALWLHPQTMASLGIAAREEALFYLAGPTEKSATVHILEHPGFCYLPQDAMAALALQEGDIVELSGARRSRMYVQLHSPPEKFPTAATLFVEEPAAQALHIRANARLALHKIPARLCWISKLKVDEVQNKARRVIGLPQAAMDQWGYYHGEDTMVYHAGRALSVAVERVATALPAGSAVLTPLVLRQAQLTSGQGVFVSLEHAPHMQVNVGVLNVEEVEHTSAKGSEHLASVFSMPCRVELSNPEKGTSLDLPLERDPYPRKNPLIRLSRTARQMLLVERGQPVLIKALPAPATRRSVGALLAHACTAILYQLLVFLINRKSIYVSVAPAHTWDDQAQVARIDGEALTVLGIESGDRVRITYRSRSISRVVLARDAEYRDPVQTPGAENAPYSLIPLQFQIGLDALARYRLAEGQMDFGCIVEIERDMASLLLKSLNLALLPIIGTVLTVLTFLTGRPLLWQILVSLLLACFFFYLALSVERAKVA